MPKIGNLITKLQINGKTFEKPEWWSTKHKLKCNLRDAENFKETMHARTTYQINSGNDIPADLFIREMQASLDSPSYKELAPWNPIFNKQKNIITYPKTRRIDNIADELPEQTNSVNTAQLDIDA